jgi:uncharacterized protein (DUF362 family)
VTTKAHRVHVANSGGDRPSAVRAAMDGIGLLDNIKPHTRIAIKPNLTYPYYKKGVTTSPEVIEDVVRILKEYTAHIAIVESDGGYGAWDASEAFEGHGLFDMGKKHGVEVVNLCKEEKRFIQVQDGLRRARIPLPVRLLDNTDLFISMPVPKIHCMTGVSLGYKNQWGCVPDTMRLRKHNVFSQAIVAINRALRPVILADGTYFLDQNGPMEGKPVRMDLIIAASEAGTFDRFVTELMGISWKSIHHLRVAARMGDLPRSLADIDFNIAPDRARVHTFRLERSLRNWIALLGFKSRIVSWFGYESWFGREVLHRILYAVAGKPVKPSAEQR